MTALQIAAALFALGLKIAEAAQLDNDELRAEVEKGLARESDVQKAMDAYHLLIGK